MARDRSESRDRRHRRSRRDSRSPDRKSHKRHSSKRRRSRDTSPAPAPGAYSNVDNPFNDSSLGKKFVWKKKEEQGAKQGLSKQQRREQDAQRRKEAERELEQLRKRRELREVEKKARDEEMARQRREMEQEKLGDWERKEEEFHLGQAKKRAELRLRNRRHKPVDVLAMNLRLANDVMPDDEAKELSSVRVGVAEPSQMVDALDLRDCEELMHDVAMYLELETNPESAAFWECMLAVVQARLSELQERSSRDAAIEAEIRQMLSAKSVRELDEIESDVTAKLTGQTGAVDVDYWERVRRLLDVQKARARIAMMHADVLERRLARIHGAGRSAESAKAVENRKRQRLKDLQCQILEGQGSDDATDNANEKSLPEMPEGGNLASDALEAALSQSQDPDEAVFSVEAALPTREYSWQDKHRPRKPRYYNRVLTGYEWNKYNQTHYDTDNPPPKVVQGYKFNLFYPDLIDKASAPTYRVERDPDGGEDTVVIRFVAGPPYEDVAFRIVSREWEFNRKRGFRNTFDRGVLQLYFRFKRHYYRR